MLLAYVPNIIVLCWLAVPHFDGNAHVALPMGSQLASYRLGGCATTGQEGFSPAQGARQWVIMLAAVCCRREFWWGWYNGVVERDHNVVQGGPSYTNYAGNHGGVVWVT